MSTSGVSSFPKHVPRTSESTHYHYQGVERSHSLGSELFFFPLVEGGRVGEELGKSWKFRSCSDLPQGAQTDPIIR